MRAIWIQDSRFFIFALFISLTTAKIKQNGENKEKKKKKKKKKKKERCVVTIVANAFEMVTTT